MINKACVPYNFLQTTALLWDCIITSALIVPLNIYTLSPLCSCWQFNNLET